MFESTHPQRNIKRSFTVYWNRYFGRCLSRVSMLQWRPPFGRDITCIWCQMTHPSVQDITRSEGLWSWTRCSHAHTPLATLQTCCRGTHFKNLLQRNSLQEATALLNTSLLPLFKQRCLEGFVQIYTNGQSHLQNTRFCPWYNTCKSLSSGTDTFPKCVFHKFMYL